DEAALHDGVVDEKIEREHETAGERAEAVAEPHVFLRVERRRVEDADRAPANHADVVADEAGHAGAVLPVVVPALYGDAEHRSAERSPRRAAPDEGHAARIRAEPFAERPAADA